MLWFLSVIRASPFGRKSIAQGKVTPGIVGTEKRAFSDRETVQACLSGDVA